MYSTERDLLTKNLKNFKNYSLIFGNTITKRKPKAMSSKQIQHGANRTPYYISTLIILVADGVHPNSYWLSKYHTSYQSNVWVSYVQ